MKIFETEHLLIRELDSDDIPGIYAYGKEAIIFQYQNFGPISLEGAEKFFIRSQRAKEAEVQKDYLYGIEVKSTALLIGDCGYFINDSHTSCEIGYNLHPDYWGKGYGTGLVKNLVANILAQHKRLNIHAECDSRNIGSKRILEKNDFELVEVRKEDFVQKGVLIDTFRYKYVVRNLNNQ